MMPLQQRCRWQGGEGGEGEEGVENEGKLQRVAAATAAAAAAAPVEAIGHNCAGDGDAAKGEIV